MSKFFLSSIVSKCQKSLVKYLSDIVDHINLQEFFENLFHLMKPWLKQQEFTQHGEKGAEKIFFGVIEKSFFCQANGSFLKGPWTLGQNLRKSFDRKALFLW